MQLKSLKINGSGATEKKKKKNFLRCRPSVVGGKGDETISVRSLECVEEIEDIIESQVKSVDGNWIQDQEGCWGRLSWMYRYALGFFLEGE